MKITNAIYGMVTIWQNKFEIFMKNVIYALSLHAPN